MKDTGGQAFPVDWHTSSMSPQLGMTLRAYFAAHAPEMPDWYFSELCAKEIPVGERLTPWQAFYQWRWEYADAMIAEGKKNS